MAQIKLSQFIAQHQIPVTSQQELNNSQQQQLNTSGQQELQNNPVSFIPLHIFTKCLRQKF